MGLIFFFFNISTGEILDSLMYYLKIDSLQKASQLFIELKEKDSSMVQDPFLRAKMASLLGIEPYPVLLLRDGGATPRFLRSNPVYIVFKDIKNTGRIGIYNLATATEEKIKLTYNRDVYPCFGDGRDTIYFLRPGKGGMFYLEQWCRGVGVEGIEFVEEFVGDKKNMFRFDYSNERIVFEYADYEKEGDFELYLYDFKDKTLKKLTNNIYFDGFPRFTPDGDVVFVSNHVPADNNIFLLDVDTGEIEPLVENPKADDREPAIAGDKLVYVSDKDGNQEIYLKDLKNGMEIRLTRNPGKDIQPDISPDGKWLVFQSERAGYKGLFIVSLLQPVSADSIVSLIKSKRKEVGE